MKNNTPMWLRIWCLASLIAIISLFSIKMLPNLQQSSSMLNLPSICQISTNIANQTKCNYQIAYDSYLSRFRHSNPKFLEFGLGCTMEYGPGKSMILWKTYFLAGIDLWFFENLGSCVEKFASDLKAMNVKIVVGDQGNSSDLNRLVEYSGGLFDIIVDDGGHWAQQQLPALALLWHTLKPGGLYFLEDIDLTPLLDGKGEYLRQNNNTTLANLLRITQRMAYHYDPLPVRQETIIDVKTVESINFFNGMCVITKSR